MCFSTNSPFSVITPVLRLSTLVLLYIQSVSPTLKPINQKDLRNFYLLSHWKLSWVLHGKLITLGKVFMDPQDPCRYDLIISSWKNYGRTGGPIEKRQTDIFFFFCYAGLKDNYRQIPWVTWNWMGTTRFWLKSYIAWSHLCRAICIELLQCKGGHLKFYGQLACHRATRFHPVLLITVFWHQLYHCFLCKFLHWWTRVFIPYQAPGYYYLLLFMTSQGSTLAYPNSPWFLRAFVLMPGRHIARIKQLTNKSQGLSQEMPLSWCGNFDPFWD